MQPEINTQQKDQKKKKNRALLLLLVILLLLVGFISNGMFSFLSRNTLNRNTLLSSSPIPLQSNIPTNITFENEPENFIPPLLEEETPPLIASTSRIRPLVSVPTPSNPVISTPNTPTIPNSPGSVMVTATLGPCTVMCASINTSIISGNLLILEQGIVYDTSPNPTVSDNKIIHTGNQLNYTSEIQSMRIVNTYYIRSYVITASGITYSNQIEINKPLSTPNSTEPSDLPEIFSNLEGAGTARSPYIITNDWELQAMMQDLDAHYRLGNNIDARGTENWNSGQGFTPIGGDGYDNTPFTGHFDGNGYGIIGLTIDREGSELNDGFNYFVGLFSRTDGAKLYNVVLQDNYILAKRHVGGIVGYTDGETEIRNAVVDGVAWARFGLYGGGLIGSMNNGLIENSLVNGDVHGSGNVIGGLVGDMYDGTIMNSTSNADVDGGGAIGGLVGRMQGGLISQSCANGNILGIRDEENGKIGTAGGGFVGVMSAGTIRDSHATGNIRIESEEAGGFVGSMSGNGSSIMRSYSTGDVFIGGARWGGGFAGRMLDANPAIGGESISTITIADTLVEPDEIGIHNSYATGDVTFTNGGYDESLIIADITIVQWTPEEFASQGEYFGGFVGENKQSATSNNYSTGRVIYDSSGFINPTSKGFAGAMTADGFYMSEDDIPLINLNNYWNTETSQQSSSAGNAIGLTNSQMYQSSTFNNWNFNMIWQSDGTSTPQLRNNANCQFTCFNPTPVIPLPPVPADCITPPITSGLIQYLDVCSTSYAEAGTDLWRDLSNNNLDIPLIPEIGYDSLDGGSLLFGDLSGSLYSEFGIEDDLADSTYMTWVKPTIDENNNDLLYTQSYDQLNSFYSYLYISGNILNLDTGNAIWNELISDYDYTDYQYNLNITLESDKWYHIAITTTVNGPTRLYINQELIFTSPDSHTFNLVDPPITISSTYINKGNISHISIYDRPLLLTEIQEFFNATQSKFSTIGEVLDLP